MQLERHGDRLFEHGRRPRVRPAIRLGPGLRRLLETQQTNAEAADFIFYDHDFVGDSAKLTPDAETKLEAMALRLPHVPFPVVVERGVNDIHPELDGRRRRVVVEQLGRLGAIEAEDRVVIAGSFAEGFTSAEGERAFVRGVGSMFGNNGNNFGRRFGGFGGSYR